VSTAPFGLPVVPEVYTIRGVVFLAAGVVGGSFEVEGGPKGMSNATRRILEIRVGEQGNLGEQSARICRCSAARQAPVERHEDPASARQREKQHRHLRMVIAEPGDAASPFFSPAPRRGGVLDLDRELRVRVVASFENAAPRGEGERVRPAARGFG